MQALGGAKNHMIVLPDADIEHGRRRGRQRRLRLGGRALHGDLGRRRGRRRRRSRWSTRSRSGCRRSRSATGSSPDSEMGPLVTREHRDKVASLHRHGRRARARRSSPTAARPRPTATASSSASSLLDDVTPEMDVYRDEIFGPVLGVARVDTYDEAVRLVNENPYGNGVAIFTRDGGVARQFQFEVEVGMVGDQRADPGAGRLLLVRRLEGLALRRPAHLRPRGRSSFYTRGKVVTSRWPDPATSKVDLGLPADALTAVPARAAPARQRPPGRARDPGRAELGIADDLAGGSRGVGESWRAATGTHEPSLYRAAAGARRGRRPARGGGPQLRADRARRAAAQRRPAVGRGLGGVRRQASSTGPRGAPSTTPSRPARTPSAHVHGEDVWSYREARPEESARSSTARWRASRTARTDAVLEAVRLRPLRR